MTTAFTGARQRCSAFPPAAKTVEQAGAVSPLNDRLGKLLAARAVDRHHPFRFAQFERGEQRDIISFARTAVATTVVEVAVCIVASKLVWKLSLPSPAAVHPHRIFAAQLP
jgi:hypothetical protein